MRMRIGRQPRERAAHYAGRVLRVVLLGATLVACGAACGGGPKRPPGICFASRSESGRPVTPSEWARLLVRMQTVDGQVLAREDCTGWPIHFTPPPDTCAVKTPPLGEPVPVPLTEESVVERVVRSDERLVWVITHHFANGDGFGPVALVRTYPRGLAVEAIGPLRLRRERVALEEWSIGNQRVLMAAGETCFDKKKPSTCHRAANVLVHRKHAFLDPPISYRDGRCIDVPWIELARSADLPLESGWNRHFEITSSLGHDDRYLVITEQVRVQDSDPDQPGIPPREVRNIDTERFIHVEEGRLLTRQHPLWPKILPTTGKVEVVDPSEL